MAKSSGVSTERTKSVGIIGLSFPSQIGNTQEKIWIQRDTTQYGSLGELKRRSEGMLLPQIPAGGRRFTIRFILKTGTRVFRGLRPKSSSYREKAMRNPEYIFSVGITYGGPRLATFHLSSC